MGKIQGVVADGIKDQILELVHHPKQVFAERRHRLALSGGLSSLSPTRAIAQVVVEQAQRFNIPESSLRVARVFYSSQAPIRAPTLQL